MGDLCFATLKQILGKKKKKRTGVNGAGVNGK